ncbi:MAG: aldehyde dehydrogenase family protein [Candidatus Sericytochromatia bacterium]|nr:aldehyde dehydrogenase family protein [Candidatus Sericytochromatia bacterium]
MTIQTPAPASLVDAKGRLELSALRNAIDAFWKNDQLGQDPLAAAYEDRRKRWNLFSLGLRDEEMEALRKYIFPYRELPNTPSAKPVPAYNLVNGEWKKPQHGATATLNCLWDRRVPLTEVADSQPVDVEETVNAAWNYWTSFEWSEETTSYRKWVVNNFSRLLEYFAEEVMREIRHVIPKTRMEAEKDFWEAKRAADHIGGNAEKALRGEIVPPMVDGHSYWKNGFLPAGVCAVVTPMNFIYGIPVIQIVGCYMSGSVMIFKGHPFGGICNTVMMRMLLAAGANPRAVHKLEGFGAGIAGLATHEKIAVVSLTGSEKTAKTIAAGRGVRTLKFEGGGCNWAYVDDHFSDEELKRIAVRLTYSKLGFSSHKCTTLHGIAANPDVLKKIEHYVNEEMDQWALQDPHLTEDHKVIGPNMVHKAQTVSNIQEAARQAGYRIAREGGRQSGTEWADHAEVIAPVIIADLKPDSTIAADWDGKGVETFNLTTTEFFMPVLCLMPLANFEEFLRFAVLTNSHDLACSIWTRDDAKLQRARRIIGGMLKENDGTDSAMDWEEFGASGIGDSGNMGVGDAETTVAIFSRRQKGRHVVF